MFYLNVEQIGDNICERYIEDGVEKIRRVPFEPTFYHHTNTPTGLKDIYGKNVQPKTFQSINDSRNWIKKMKDMAQEVRGMDNLAYQYIYENYHGPISFDMAQIRIAFVDIEVYSRDGFPSPQIARWEIDAITHYDSVDDVYYVFATREWWREKSCLDEDIVRRVEYKLYNCETDMMLAYVQFWRDKMPAVVTGWNSEIFDIPYIVNRLKKLFGDSYPKKLSPWGRVNEKTIKGMGGKELQTYDISGVASLDYLALYKKFTFKTRPSYKLDYVALVELGDQKIMYEGSLGTLAEDNPQLYIDYNIKDVDLIINMDKSLLLFELVFSLSYYAHMNLSDVTSPLKTWDAIIYNSLMDQNVVVPENKQKSKDAYEGAYVKEPVPGYYKWILSFDLTSLYPHLIMQYNISPETIMGRIFQQDMSAYVNKTAEFDNKGNSCCPNGMMYAKHKRGIIPIEIEKVFFQRKAAKTNEFAANHLSTLASSVVNARGGTITKDTQVWAGIEAYFKHTEGQLIEMTDEQLSSIINTANAKERSYNVEQQARKVLINSLYGALGNQWFRYYDLRNAEAITLSGQLSILWIERKLNEYFNSMMGTKDYPYVIYIDTDSVYVRLDKFVGMMLDRAGKTEEEVGKEKLVDMLDKFAKTKVEPYIGESYQELADYMNAYDQKMFMDREVIADTGFWTAKKRYALNVWDSEGKRKLDKQGNLVPKLKIMGLDTQRSSTPVFVQNALYESVRIILQEDEKALQKQYLEVEKDYKNRHYTELASVTSANNIMKDATPDFRPLKGCRGPIKGVLAFNRMASKFPTVTAIQDGEKVALLTLREPNILGSANVAYPSGEKLPEEFGLNIEKMIDYPAMMDKHYTSPLKAICDAIGWDYEEKATLDWLFGG
ncbi:MAG: DNA polymerase domain-containing protein [Aeromonas veronii]